MTAALFEAWLAKAMPLFKIEARKHGYERVVVVMDNASYHGQYLQKVSLKQSNWIMDMNIVDSPEREQQACPCRLPHRQRRGVRHEHAAGGTAAAAQALRAR
jgi:hypothetical protein